MIVWLNERFVEAGPGIDVADRGLLLGDGAFETVLVAAGRPAFLDAHLERLRFGLATLEIAPPAALADLRAIIAELAAQNRLAGPAVARLTVTRGKGSRGLAFPGAHEATPTVIAALSPRPPADAGPALLHVAARLRFARASTARFKAIGGYVEHMLALNDARKAGAGEAVLLNEAGRVACACAANLILIDRDGAASTPAVAEGALPGIVRGALLGGADRHGVPIAERAVGADELRGALPALTSSLIGVRAARLPSSPDWTKAQLGAVERLRTWYDALLDRELAGEEGR